MMKAQILSRKVLAVFLALSFALPLGVLICPSDALAVKPPAVARRADEERDAEAEARSQERSANCTYGWSKATGKCYQPKEGQLYKNPNTGKMEIKKVEKWNMPWH